MPPGSHVGPLGLPGLPEGPVRLFEVFILQNSLEGSHGISEAPAELL